MLSILQCLRDVAKYVKGVADYPVKSIINEDGSGYTKWKSGKLEQWGSVSFSAVSGAATSKIKFPTAFKDTKYNVTLTGNRNFTSAVTGLFESNNAANVERTTTTTVVRIIKSGASYNMTANYQAVGKWK
jgi:hypothetical protein